MSGRDTIENVRWLNLRREEQRDRCRRRGLLAAFAFVVAVWALAGWLVLS